jgi:hypothetical protein
MNTIKYFISIFILGYSSIAYSQLKNKVALKKLIRPDSLYTKFQIDQYCQAYNSDKNATKSKGESHSENKAISIDTNFIKNGFFLILDNKIITVEDHIDSNLCHYLYVVNKSDSIMHFDAQDVVVNIVPEALDFDSIWKPIGFISGSSCGNSYHSIILDKNEYWKFKTYIFKGNFKTKIRYVFYATDYEGKKYYSNTIPA